MVARLIRSAFVAAALMGPIAASAGDAFGWGRGYSYYPCYPSSGYTYYHPATTYYYPQPAPAGVSTAAPEAGQPYVAMMPVVETPVSPAVVPAPAPQYYAPAGGYYGGYGSGNVPRTSWDLGKFPPY
jgi:hypothetical protein